MMTSQILKSVDFTKTQKSRFLENKTFISSNEKFNYLSRATYCRKQCCGGGNLENLRKIVLDLALPRVHGLSSYQFEIAFCKYLSFLQVTLIISLSGAVIIVDHRKTLDSCWVNKYQTATCNGADIYFSTWSHQNFIHLTLTQILIPLIINHVQMLSMVHNKG